MLMKRVSLIEMKFSLIYEYLTLLNLDSLDSSLVILHLLRLDRCSII